MSKSHKLREAGKRWQQSPAASPRRKHTLQTELDLEPWITQATGSLSSNCTSYAGAVLYIKYINTHVCPCGMVFHFKSDSAGKSACKKALKAHLQTHVGIHFWDFSASSSSHAKHARYLNQKYPGAAIISFEKWTIPPVYSGVCPICSGLDLCFLWLMQYCSQPDNVAQFKPFFLNQNLLRQPVPTSATASTNSSRQASSLLSAISDTDDGQYRDSEDEDEPSPEKETPFHENSSRSYDEIFCVCRKPEDGKRYLACDCCDLWFHPGCVGIPKQQVDLVHAFYCPACEAADDGTRAKLARQASLRQREGTPSITVSHRQKGYACMEWPMRKDPMSVRGVYELSDDES